MSGEVKIVENYIPGILREFPKAVQALTRETAYLGKKEAESRCPTKTRRLISTIKTYFQDGSFVIEAGGKAFDGHEVTYAEFVELGTSKMAAQPFMTPASEKANEFFFNRIEKLPWESWK